jgi:hypothetical protein
MWFMSREEHRVRAFQIRVLRIKFGSLREEATRRCRILHNRDFNSL